MKRRWPPGNLAKEGGIPVQIPMLPSLVLKVDSWIANQADRPSRPEAIRRLIEQGLTVVCLSTKALRPDELNAANDG